MLPTQIHSLADLAAVERASRRFETPCGDGVVVWHVWGEGEPIVLLHGGSGSWTHWVRNIGALVQAGRRVIVPDLPGFGESSRPPVGEDADVLPEWIELGLDHLIGPIAFDVVGFSFGTMVACFMAARRPTQVRQLILSGAPALSTEPMNPLRLLPWAHLPEGDVQTAIHRHNLSRLMLANEASVDALSICLHSRNLVRDRLKQRRISKTDILMRVLPTVQCQVDGIWGEQDVLYVNRQHLIEQGLSLAPGFKSLTLIKGAGHWVQFEAAESFNATLVELLRA